MICKKNKSKLQRLKSVTMNVFGYQNAILLGQKANQLNLSCSYCMITKNFYANIWIPI